MSKTKKSYDEDKYTLMSYLEDTDTKKHIDKLPSRKKSLWIREATKKQMLKERKKLTKMVGQLKDKNKKI